jgi:hypothetical protein
VNARAVAFSTRPNLARFWDSIDYQVKNYPLAETTIRAYTLSFEESWLGV